MEEVDRYLMAEMSEEVIGMRLNLSRDLRKVLDHILVHSHVYRPNIDELLLGLVVFPSSPLIRKTVLYREDGTQTLHLVLVFHESRSSPLTFWSRSIPSYVMLEVMGLLEFRI